MWQTHSWLKDGQGISGRVNGKVCTDKVLRPRDQRKSVSAAVRVETLPADPPLHKALKPLALDARDVFRLVATKAVSELVLVLGRPNRERHGRADLNVLWPRDCHRTGLSELAAPSRGKDDCLVR